MSLPTICANCRHRKDVIFHGVCFAMLCGARPVDGQEFRSFVSGCKTNFYLDGERKVQTRWDFVECSEINKGACRDFAPTRLHQFLNAINRKGRS